MFLSVSWAFLCQTLSNQAVESRIKFVFIEHEEYINVICECWSHISQDLITLTFLFTGGFSFWSFMEKPQSFDNYKIDKDETNYQHFCHILLKFCQHFRKVFRAQNRKIKKSITINLELTCLRRSLVFLVILSIAEFSGSPFSFLPVCEKKQKNICIIAFNEHTS